MGEYTQREGDRERAKEPEECSKRRGLDRSNGESAKNLRTSLSILMFVLEVIRQGCSNVDLLKSFDMIIGSLIDCSRH